MGLWVGWLVDWLEVESVGQIRVERELEESWQDLLKRGKVLVALLLHMTALEAWYGTLVSW